MDQNTEIIIFVTILVGISILLFIIYMFPRISKYIENIKTQEMTEEDLKLVLRQILNSNFIMNNKIYNVKPETMVKLQPYIETMVECFTKSMIEYYNKNNLYNITYIVRDIKNNNIPYNFYKAGCKNSVIAALNKLQNQYGSSFKFISAINHLTNPLANNNGFTPNDMVYDSNIVTSSGDAQMYNFSEKQLNYLNKFINN